MTFVRFGLIVTGKGEREFLPKLFRAISAGAHCTFELIRKSEQLRPITSQRRLLKLKGKTIPSIDEEQYGLPAHAYLRTHQNGYVLVVDDLEAHANPSAVFDRYRKGLDAVLGRQGRSTRAAVFFLVNMLEAYYFAHAACVNAIAGRSILSDDHDVSPVESKPATGGRIKTGQRRCSIYTSRYISTAMASFMTARP